MSNYTGGSIPGTKKYKKEQAKTKASKDAAEKAAWLKKTRNSPAAQSGAFTDDERWAMQQKVRARKAKRTAAKNQADSKKSTPKNTTKSSTPKNNTKGSVKNKDGSTTTVSSSKGKTTYTTTEKVRAKGIRGLFGKKKDKVKNKLTIPNLPNLK